MNCAIQHVIVKENSTIYQRYAVIYVRHVNSWLRTIMNSPGCNSY